MPAEPQPGEVWFADLGMIEKSRPVLVLAFPRPADARARVVVAPLTSQIRGLVGEVAPGKTWVCPTLAFSGLTVGAGDLSAAERQDLVV